MRFARDPSGQRVEPTRDIPAVCPGCGAEVISKIGDIVAPHWAHKSVDDCDPWHEPESQFHVRWKNVFPDDWQEVTIGRHRADVVTPNGFVLEVQKSALDPGQIREREEFYGDMAWVLAGMTWTPNSKWHREGTSFHLKKARKIWLYFKKPVFIDFGGYWMVGGELEPRLFRSYGRSKYGGDGEWYREDVFIDWISTRRQLGGHP